MNTQTNTTRFDTDQLHQDPQHVALINDDVAALQSYGLMAKGPNLLLEKQRAQQVAVQQEKLKKEKQITELLYGGDAGGLELFQQEGLRTNAKAPNDNDGSFDALDEQLQSQFDRFKTTKNDQNGIDQIDSPPTNTSPLSSSSPHSQFDHNDVTTLSSTSHNIASRLKVDPHADLKRKGNELSHMLLEPMYDIMGQGNATTITPDGSIPVGLSTRSGTSIDHLKEQTLAATKQRQKAQPIGGFSQINPDKQYSTLQPMSHSITGNIISSISLNNDEFGSLAGSPTFRINPQNLKKVQNGTHGINTNEDIDDDDDIQMSKDLDAHLALDNQGLLGLNDSPLQKHADEFSTNSLIPTLGFLRQYHSEYGTQQKRQMGEVEDIDGLGDTVGGIGGLQRTDGHYTNPRQDAIISGRRSRAIETIARTSAAVLAKKQLLAHNRGILTAINPSLAQGSKEKRDDHYIDLYSLGYQITRIHLTKDLSTCVINWSAPCLFPIPQSKNTMELERPLLDVVNQTMNSEMAKLGRIELQPMNEAMRSLAKSNTHLNRRADYSIGANLLNNFQFTGDAYNILHQREMEELRLQERQNNRKTEIFFDDRSKVAIKREPSGQMKILSQGDPNLWKLRPIFQRGSYVPGTVDVLPPHLRRNSQIMTENQRQTRENKLREQLHLENMNIQAGLQGQEDPRLLSGGLGGDEHDDQINAEIPQNGFGLEEIGLGPNVNASVAKETLDAMLYTDLRNSQLSYTTYKRSVKLVAAATQYYLTSMVPSIRWALGQALNTKFVPQVKFEFDAQYGAAKQRAKTINAVLQRQYKKQIDKVEFGDADEDEYHHLDQDHRKVSIHTTGTAQERDEKVQLILEKQKLLSKGRIDDVQIIDDFVKNERMESTRQKVREFEHGSFQDYDTVDPRDEALMKRVQVKDDNVAKMRASAQALKTGQANDIAFSTRLKYHDITKADKVKLVGLYLDIPESQARQLSEDRIEVVISMLRREMAAAERKKQREAFKEEKLSQGLSKAQLDRELLKFDTKQKKKLKEDSDYEEGVQRWEAGVDSDRERPDYSHMLLEGDNDHVEDFTGDVSRKSGSSLGHNLDGLEWGKQDDSIAAAFVKHGADKEYAAKKQTQQLRSKPGQDDLIKFRQQYLYGDDNDNVNIVGSGTQQHQAEQIPKLVSSKFLEFESSEDFDGSTHDSADSDATGGDGFDYKSDFEELSGKRQDQQQKMPKLSPPTINKSINTSKNVNFLQFSDDSEEQDDYLPDKKSKNRVLNQQSRSFSSTITKRPTRTISIPQSSQIEPSKCQQQQQLERLAQHLVGHGEAKSM
jgi:hypothetical protein